MFKQCCWARLHKTFSPVIVLLLLVWITPVAAEPTSRNDPFRAIALHAPKRPDPPICCLKPLPPLEPVEDDLLLSFEEWKARQHHASENASSTGPSSNGANKIGNGTGDGSEPVNTDDVVSPALAAQEDKQPHVPAKPQEVPLHLSPHFRVPLVDRFNYASLDCSARVHKAHKGAKHPSNILSSKKDRYMLSPCKTEGGKQFVVVELCEDIRIDTVQLANFEFFSGVFKDFTVSVAKTSSTDEEDWTVAGTYRAKNVRGVQSFHTPTSLRDFYRYLRIDFHSHYGSEYYCPVSLLRVYGLTHLEEWKWELWEAESRAKTEAALKDARTPRTTEAVNHSNLTNDTVSINDTDQTIHEESGMPSTLALPINETEKEVGPSPTTTTTESPIHSTDTYLSNAPSITQPPEFETAQASPATVATTSISPLSPTPISSILQPSSTTPPGNGTPSPVPSQAKMNTTAIITTLTSVNTELPITRTSSSIILTTTPLSASHPFLPIPVSGGESVYRTIMNRLVGLQRNHTLYEQYMAQQQSIVRDALKRLSEDIGRLEGLGKAQRQAHERAVLEWEKQRKQWQMEYAQLLQRIEYLSDEIIMEKRLGVAQLCLLLAVLVFMGLTRGSRGPIIEDGKYWRPKLKSLSVDLPRPRAEKPEDFRMPQRNGERAEFTKASAANSGSGLSSPEGAGSTASSSSRYPLTTIELNTPPHQQQTKRSGVEKQHPENRQNVPILLDGNGTPSRARSRTKSRSRSRTSSWTGKGILVLPGPSSSRQAVETRGGHLAAVTNTPSKGSRVAGVYSPGRPGLASARTTTSVPHQRRVIPLQRSHSSHGVPGSIDISLAQTWTGSGSAPKSARRWARTAHLHEVKGKWKENGSGYRYSVPGGGMDSVMKGIEGEGGSGVFGRAGSAHATTEDMEKGREKLLILHSDDADADADGWESASDVGIDSIEGI